MMEENNNIIQLEVLKELAKRNDKLNESLGHLLDKYENINSSNEQYQALLKEFGLDVESRKSQKDVKRYRMVSMLYITVYGFDEISHREDADVQLDRLDEIFFVITEIAQKYGLVKIPTIGDNMLLAGGIITENNTNPIDVSLAAYEIMMKMREFRETLDCIWEIGIGIHTGPIIGRFVGKKSVPYTLSGNNVLTASRLGFLARRGHIAVSPMTYELVKEFFHNHKKQNKITESGDHLP